jgi:hypothetical protein
MRSKLPITAQQIAQICCGQNIEEGFQYFVIEDVLRIVNGGYRYPPRSPMPQFRYPEDYSVPIALRFGIEARTPDAYWG